LDLPATWRGKRIDRKVSSYRYVGRGIRALTCRAADISRIKKAFAEGRPGSFDHDPHDYRGYLAEYPRRWPYRRQLIDPRFFADQSAGIDFNYMALRQARGEEWGRDYSPPGRSPSLLMPSTELIEAGDLHWDGHGGWLDAQGRIQVVDPWWYCDKGPGLIICLDYLDKILEEKGKVLAVMGVQVKFIAGTSTGPGRLSERTLFVRSKGQTKLIGRKIEND
jgi:hypothetical protein